MIRRIKKIRQTMEQQAGIIACAICIYGGTFSLCSGCRGVCW
jgi:hypothetical protein